MESRLGSVCPRWAVLQLKIRPVRNQTSVYVLFLFSPFAPLLLTATTADVLNTVLHGKALQSGRQRRGKYHEQVHLGN